MLLPVNITQETTVFQYAHLLNNGTVISKHYTTNGT
jgi:hypothetical protein